MRHDIPPAPGPEWVFSAPPGWNVPPGFDPRTGLQPDPLWPVAPGGWAYWVKASVPAAARGTLVERVGGPRVLVGLAFVGVIAVVAISSFLGSAHSPSSGVGSCWKPSTSSQYAEADCNDSAAGVHLPPRKRQCGYQSMFRRHTAGLGYHVERVTGGQ